ncbi:hypothetical protein [Streptomyces sp. NPDC017964]|uniref:hypothetical protein n=1 Tax=Streptomyces sp. NPDC017964 TaxID=3365022 RepID=UPI0037AF026E
MLDAGSDGIETVIEADSALTDTVESAFPRWSTDGDSTRSRVVRPVSGCALVSPAGSSGQQARLRPFHAELRERGALFGGEFVAAGFGVHESWFTFRGQHAA